MLLMILILKLYDLKILIKIERMKTVFLFIFIICIGTLGYSQNPNEKAKELYFKALELHESKKYAESNEKLKEAQNILVSNNLTIQYLRVKNFYALKNYEQTKKEISLYLKLNPKQDEAFTEVMKYKGEIEEGEKQEQARILAERKEKERLQAEKERQDKILLEKDRKYDAIQKAIAIKQPNTIALIDDYIKFYPRDMRTKDLSKLKNFIILDSIFIEIKVLIEAGKNSDVEKKLDVYFRNSYAKEHRLYNETITIIDIVYPSNGVFTDIRDGEHYKWVRIGRQVWMAENLAYLPSVAGPTTGSQTKPYYYVFGYKRTKLNTAKSHTNYTTYGVLYNWPAAMNGAESSKTNPSGVQGVCPDGWHLPSDAEWEELTNFIGSNPSSKLKAQSGWQATSNRNCTDNYGFSAIPGGTRSRDGTFQSISLYGYWWGSTDYSTEDARGFQMSWDNQSVVVFSPDKGYGFSVRCVRD
jgi:uncharacterized protein (TIGR02145 family)